MKRLKRKDRYKTVKKLSQGLGRIVQHRTKKTYFLARENGQLEAINPKDWKND